MRVAINMVGHEDLRNFGDIIQLARATDDAHEFIFFSDRAIKGITCKVIGTEAGNFLSRRWWLDVKLPAALKKYGADVLVNIGGDASLRTKIPQLLCAGNLRFADHPKEYTRTELLFLKSYFPKYLAKVKAIITPSHAVKDEISKKFTVAAEKVHAIHTSIGNEYKPLEWEQKEQVKDGYADGREYFLFTGGFEEKNELLTVLKAFSHFKKWQRSNMKLIVTGDVSGAAMNERLGKYKFRDDVVVLENITAQQEAKLLAAAYAFIHVPLYDASGSVVLKALKAGTPVIASDTPSIKEIAGDAVVYTDVANDEMLGAQMISLHKDEALRTSYIKAGSIQAENYPGNNAAERWMQLIERTVANS